MFLLVDPFTRSVKPVVLATVVISQLSHNGINISKYFLLAQKRCEEFSFLFKSILEAVIDSSRINSCVWKTWNTQTSPATTAQISFPLSTITCPHSNRSTTAQQRFYSWKNTVESRWSRNSMPRGLQWIYLHTASHCATIWSDTWLKGLKICLVHGGFAVGTLQTDAVCSLCSGTCGDDVFNNSFLSSMPSISSKRWLLIYLINMFLSQRQACCCHYDFLDNFLSFKSLLLSHGRGFAAVSHWRDSLLSWQKNRDAMLWLTLIRKGFTICKCSLQLLLIYERLKNPCFENSQNPGEKKKVIVEAWSNFLSSMFQAAVPTLLIYYLIVLPSPTLDWSSQCL